MAPEVSRVNLRQLEWLTECLGVTRELTEENVKAQYERSAGHFEPTLEFLRSFGLLAKTGGKIRITSEYRGVLQQSIRAKRAQQLKGLLVRELLQSKSPYNGDINLLLGSLRFERGVYVSTLSTRERLGLKGVRNLLIELGVLEVAPGGPGQYVLSQECLERFLSDSRNRRVSQREFEHILRRRAELGHEAELRILDYERTKLSDYPSLVRKIEHVASSDVQAGFDIRSFEVDRSRRSPREIVIEVKAVSIVDYGFYWSRNEMRTAKQHIDQYLLYLLPRGERSIFEMDALMIIRNPLKNVYNAKKGWNRETEVMSFRLC